MNSGNLLEYSKIDFQFHDLIYQACGNWLLTELLANIKDRSRPLVVDIAPILHDLLKDHQELVNALKERNAESAVDVIRRHYGRMRHLINMAREPGPEEGLENAAPGER